MDAALIKKLKFKEGQEIHILNMPEECRALLPDKYDSGWPDSPGQFLMAFTSTPQGLEQLLAKHSAVIGNAEPAWISYPKKSSTITSDLSREVIWGILGTKGLSPVAQVSINENWSALRCRPEESVKHTAKGSLEVPEDMKEVLQTSAKAMQQFVSLSATNRREYIAWITEAKKPETRKKRLEQLVSRLEGGLKNPSEK